MKKKIKFKGRLKSYMCWPLYLTFVWICADGIALRYDRRLGYGMVGFTVFYFALVLFLYVRSKSVVANELISFATQYSSVQKRLLNEFEVPYALLEYSGKILWVNDKFAELMGVDKKYHKSITTIFPALTKELLQKSDGEKSINLTLKEQDFRVALKRIYFEELNSVDSLVTLDESNEYLTAVYLFDETEKNQYMRENQEQKMVAGLVYIDNYDEALDSIEDVKRSLLVALIDRKVNKYFTELDALVRKIEKDKYFVVLKYQYLAKLREDRFSLIEDVKTVKVGNEMAVTLSIGIGANGESYTQNYEYARMSIDLALGRGGDQVVVRDGEDITYYGGKTQQVERNTRVKARVKAHALREIIESREHVIIMGHSISDVDSLGAAIGIYCAAKVLGKKAQIVLNEITSSLRPLVECFTEEKGYPAEEKNCELEVGSTTYKVLKRDTVTAFYDADGNTLLDVTNDRLKEEYEAMESLDETEPKSEIGRAIAVIEKQAFDEAVYMGKTSLADIVTGNVPDPTPEEVQKAMEEQRVKARSAREVTNYMGADATVYDEIDVNVTTEFVGYDHLAYDSEITVLTTEKEIAASLMEGQKGTVFV